MNFENYLPPGISIDDLIVVVSALSSLSVVLLVWYALAPADRGATRARMLAEQRKAMKAGIAGPVRRQNKERAASTSFMHDVVNKLQLLKSTHAEKTAIKLLRAGWRDKDALVYYLFFKLLLPFVLGGVAVVATFVFDAYDLDLTRKMAVCVGAVVLGAYLPDLIIKNQTQKRRDKLSKSVPDALDLMVICAEAGLSLDATLSRVSGEMENTDPELAEELSLTSLELGFLPDRRKALSNLGLRTDLSVLRSLTNTLMQSERYGTPLASSLRVMASESRDERIMKAEEKAARLPAMLTVPMIIFIMPPLFVVLIGPAVISTIDALRGI
jgi:tight adherence protein C